MYVGVEEGSAVGAKEGRGLGCLVGTYESKFKAVNQLCKESKYSMIKHK
jgi:hypothetical protein